MTNLYETFKDEIWGPDDNTQFSWFEKHREVHWNDDNDLADLFEGDGETYSCEMYGSGLERDGLVLYTLHNGCGDKIQAIFDLSKKVDEDEYYNSLEEQDEEE